MLVKKDGPFKINDLGKEFLDLSEFLDEFLVYAFYGPLTLKAFLGQFNFLVIHKKRYYEEIVQDFFSSKVKI